VGETWVAVASSLLVRKTGDGKAVMSAPLYMSYALNALTDA
jgi:hypothetical protein